jgi:hypothetical protein
MMKSFMIHRQPNCITATRVQNRAATRVFDPMLRFRSLNDLVAHFAALGVPACALEAAQVRVDLTGKATLVFFESQPN